mmetsp:Transcript_29784/g.81691  ORF Transcript_29784/g.81691 Transcript_29784/m.81691 type:complete len:330 (-) Transcript_29784:189-1178(-)
MPGVQVHTIGTVRAEFADADAQAQSLQEELARARSEAAEAHRAGAAVFSALEAAMAPLMAELAAERRIASERGVDPEELAQRAKSKSSSREAMEQEVEHLKLDIEHYREQVGRLHSEEQQRARELRRLQAELSESGESLAYEQHRARLSEAFVQMGVEGTVDGWEGLGPMGTGRRTIEVRAEMKLREAAEKRNGRLTREVLKLASDSSAQQVEIARLSKRLSKTRGVTQDRGKQLQGVASMSDVLQKRAKRLADGPTQMATDGEPSAVQGRGAEDEERNHAIGKSPDGGMGYGSGRRAGKHGDLGNLIAPKRSWKTNASSTGKLPQLSF